MSAKTNAEVIIDGKVYTLSGYEGEEYLQKVATYINSKINEFESIEEYRHIPLNMKSTLKDKEIYDLKHDLIANQIKTETAEASMKELEAENKELLLNKARLEATLEDTLLDGKIYKKQ